MVSYLSFNFFEVKTKKFSPSFGGVKQLDLKSTLNSGQNEPKSSFGIFLPGVDVNVGVFCLDYLLNKQGTHGVRSLI